MRCVQYYFYRNVYTVVSAGEAEPVDGAGRAGGRGDQPRIQAHRLLPPLVIPVPQSDNPAQSGKEGNTEFFRVCSFKFRYGFIDLCITRDGQYH